MNSHLMIVFAIPFFLLLMGLEALWGYAKDKHIYRLNDTLSNLMIGIGNRAFNLIWKAGILGNIHLECHPHFAFQQPKTLWSFSLCLVAFDFLFYWAHRWGHQVNLFWGAHMVHHSSKEYNLSVALRQSWFHNVLAFFVFLPLPILGFQSGSSSAQRPELTPCISFGFIQNRSENCRDGSNGFLIRPPTIAYIMAVTQSTSTKTMSAY